MAEARTPAAFQAEGSRCRQEQRLTAAVAAGGGVAGRGSLPTGIDATLGSQGRVVTHDEAATSPIQTSKRARGTTARTDTATRYQE